MTEAPRENTNSGTVPPPTAAGAAAEGVLFALLVSFMLWTRLFQASIWIDDAFIHFRNARNFAEGMGLLYNPGERLIGSTSPVYVFLLGVMGRLSGGDIPELARGLNAAADLGSAALVLLLLARAGVPRLFRYGIAFAVFAEPLGLVYSAAGMEMSLFILASLAIIVAAEGGRWLPAGLLLGLLGWIRPEGVTVAAAVLLALAIGRRSGPALKMVGVATITALLVGGCLLLAYGTVLPQSLLAKASSPWFPTWGEQDGALFFRALARLGPLPAFFPVATASEEGLDRAVSLGFAFVHVLLMVAGVARARHRIPVAAVALFTFALLYFLFYALANPMMFEWYYVPWGFLGTLLGGLGIWAVVEWLIEFGVAHGELNSAQAPRWRAIAAILAGLVLALGQANAARLTGHFETEGKFRRLTLRFVTADRFDRLRLYEQAGRVMEGWREALPGAVVATPEIGVFGWNYRGKVLDPYALVSPEALDVLEPAARDALPEEVRAYHPVNVYVHHRPEFIMTAGLFLPYVPEAMDEQFREVSRPDVPLLRLFVRRDLPDAVQRIVSESGR